MDNASAIVDDNLRSGNADRPALKEADGARRSRTYRELAAEMNRAGGALRRLGVDLEQRVLMCMLDTVDFPAVFFGAMKAGAVPVPVNTLLTTSDYDFMLKDSRARALVVSGALFEKFAPILEGQPFLRSVVIADPPAGLDPAGKKAHALAPLLESAPPDLTGAPTTEDDAAFWLYSSGSTGKPKGAVHLHGSIARTAELFGRGILQLGAGDVVFSAAKLFFAYGLGNAMSFPFLAGASSILLSERPTPASVMRVFRELDPTVYFGVPTLYASILADPASHSPRPGARLRLCVSAGETLPEDLEARWRERFGVHIIDGLGSTEMLHIFLSDGRPVPGYEVAVVDEHDQPLKKGEIGELKVSGPTSAAHYWNQREKSRHTFRGRWTFTGDKYLERDDGKYIYCGRSDDMIKVGGIWVSPAEVEAALACHDRVLEAAVIGVEDELGLVKTKAFVVLKPGAGEARAGLEDELKQFVKSKLAPFKYPRSIEFLDALPKTATGKIQRFKLRNRG